MGKQCLFSLRAERVARGLLLDDVSALSGLSVSTLSRIERGLPATDAETIARVREIVRSHRARRVVEPVGV